MNNAHFRKLVSDNKPRASSNSPSSSSSTSSSKQDAASVAPTLGSRQKAFIPMTPRSIGGGGSVDFAKQLAAHRAAQNPTKEKKFKSSAPLGSHLAQGYVDRAKARSDDQDGDNDEDDKEKRLRALAELAKEGKVDREIVEQQSRLFGGDVGSTHLVKGLDFALLKRVKKGEDVFSGKKRDSDDTEEDGDGAEEDLDDVLDKELEKEVAPVAKDDKKKKVQEEPPKKLTRAEILANLKKSRQEAAAKSQPVLGSKFKKIGDKWKQSPKTAMQPPPPPPPQTKDKTHHPKKKRKTEATAADATSLTNAGKEKKEGASDLTEKRASSVMGMLPDELPQGAFAAAAAASAAAADADDDDDGDIFAGAGVDYDPLAGLEDSSDSDSESDGEIKSKKPAPPPPPPTEDMPPPPPPPTNKPDMPPPPPPPPHAPSGRRNYFGAPTSEESTSVSNAPLSSTRMSTSELLASNPELAAAIKKASSLNPLDDPNSEEAKKAARHKAMLESVNRDEADLDMGFGESRTFGDEDEDEGGVGAGGKSGRKRGKKKKKDE